MTSELLVLPCINRHFPRVVSLGLSGILAYGCRYNIIFLDARRNPPLALDSKFIYNAHLGKIVALSLCNCKNSELIASVGDDCQIKVWDVATQTCVNSREIKENIHVIEWIYGSSNTLVFPCDTRSISKWNFTTNTITKIRTDSEMTITTIVSCKNKPHLLAVGHNNGTITIMDIVQEKVLQKLKSHSMEISCLSWSPNEPDVLLSVSLDFSMRLWKIGEDKPKNTYYVPTGRMKPDDKKKTKIVGICHPRKPNVVICTNSWGDMGEITLFEDEKPRFMHYGAPNIESNCKFATAVFTDTVETDQGMKDILYCFDSYKLSIWNLYEKKFVSQIPFLMGYVYDLSSSPKDPSFLAISNGDGILRVSNLQGESKVDMISVYVHYKTKILTTSWHPTLENIIAYGTDEGRVGIIDTYKKKVMYYFETYHKEKVYRVCWGPCKKAQEEDAVAIEYFIYSSGGGITYINRFNRPKDQALKFDDLSSRPPDLDYAEKTQSEVCWRSDFSCVCIGNYKGFVDLYDGELIFLSRYTAEMKSVECLCWHPEMTYASPLGSPLKCWLACSGNDADIYIFDTTKILEKKNSEEIKDTASEWALKKLVGHKKRVYSLCWSHHSDGHLVSSSKDGSALVWNACTGSIIASYLDHREVVLTVHWSMFNPDIIYSGGQDSCVRIWKISEQSVIAPSEKGVVKKKMKKPKQISSRKEENGKDSENESAVLDDEENQGNSEKSINERNNIKTSKAGKIKEDNKEDSSTSNEEKGDTIQLASSIRTFNQMSATSLGRRSTKLFPNLATSNNPRNYHSAPNNVKIEGNLKDCMQLADILCRGSSTQLDEIKVSDNIQPPENAFTDDEILKFGLYTNQATAMRMIELQADYHRSKEQVDNMCLTTLSVMSGNLQTMLKLAAESGHLTCYHVSLAPTVSHSFWLEMCEKYASQLVQEHQAYPASAYFLMCNKIYEAINIVADKGNIIDALVLAKARLPESDPLIQQLIWRVRKKFVSSCDIAGEAKCFLALNEPLQAAKALASGMDPNCARAASYICKKYKLDTEADKYIFLSMERCLTQRDWASFKLLMDQEPHMQVYSALSAVHEAFIHHVRNLKKKDGISVKEIFSQHDSTEPVKFWTGNTCIESKQSFIEHVYHILLSRSLLPAEKPALKGVLEALEILSTKRKTFDTASDAHIAIAIHITKFIFLSLMEDFEMATASFLKIFESSYNIVFLPRIVCLLFLPMHLLWSDDTKSIICKDITTSDEESGTNNVVSQFQIIFQSMRERIASFRHSPIDLFLVSKEGLHSNLGLITDKIGDILFAKEVSEYLLAYFVSSICYDLMKLVGKKDFKLECCVGKSTCSKLEETVVESALDGKMKTDIPSENCSANESSESENTTDTKHALQELIDAVIKEAEDKAKSLIELENSIVLESTSGNDSSRIIEIPNQTFPECDTDQTTEASNLCTNQVSITNEDEVCLRQDSEECQDESNNKAFAENLTHVQNDIDSSEISSSINLHTQCLANIELFYNVVSLIVSNICKEEFALLDYLKEHLKHLTATRASILLSKFSKESKAESDKLQPCPEINGIPVANKAKTPDNVECPDIIQNVESTKSCKMEVEVCNGSVDENSLSSESIHVTSIMEQSANLVPQADNQCNGVSMLTEISSNENCCESINDSQNDESANEVVQTDDTDKTEVRIIDGSSGENVDLSNLMIKESANHSSDTENQHSVTNALPEKTSESELSAIVYNDHNYSSPDKDPSVDKEETNSVSRISDNPLASLDDVSTENLQQELTEISELISHLELKSKWTSYPSPFEVIPKILHVLHDVRRNSSCTVVQEKLHKFIDEIVCWSQTFSVAEINFVCEICRAASNV